LEEHRGQDISGEDIAGRLFLSRNAVWKGIGELRKEGYTINSMTKRGYRLEVENDLLSAEGIRTYLPGKTNVAQIHLLKSTDSTNQQGKALALEGAAHGTVILAESQTAGRGRKGRQFYSPPAQGIYMSIILRPKLTMNRALLITAGTAVVVAESLEVFRSCQVQIKWVNDLFLSGKKIGGILTEATADWESGQVEYIILGIGLNISPGALDFPSEIQSIAGTLYPAGEKPALRNRLAAEIIDQVLALSDALESNPLETQKQVMAKYRERSCVINQDITVFEHPGLQEGKAIDINDEGHLLVVDKLGKRWLLNSGEISIKLQA
jgi:BirA family biotin operon repressor/biotin-[acetyl-CoA-carboxylase] ligase